jgi:hypothetical protein
MSAAENGRLESAALTAAQQLRSKCEGDRRRIISTPVSRDAITELACWPELLRTLAKSAATDIAGHGEPTLIQKIGDELQAVFGAVESLLIDCQKIAVTHTQSNGHSKDDLLRLNSAHKEVIKLKAETLGNWPWPPTPHDELELCDEQRRGDHQSLAEAFAGIAGVDQQAWLKKVEARKQDLHSRLG